MSHIYLSSAARQPLIKDIGIHAIWMDPSEPFQLKFLLHFSPCSATIFLCANISKFICVFFFIEKKIMHTFHFLTWISLIYLMTFFSLKHQLFLSKETRGLNWMYRQILEINSSDTQNIIVLFSKLKLCLLEQLHYYFYFILYFYKYIMYFKSKERLVAETVFTKPPSK